MLTQHTRQEFKHFLPILYIMQGNVQSFKDLLDHQLIDINMTIPVNDLNDFLKFKPNWKLNDDIATQRWENITLLHIAALLHEEQIVTLLLQAGAPIKAIEQQGIAEQCTPYYFAEINESKNDTSENLYIKLIKAGDIPSCHFTMPYWYYIIKRNHVNLLKLVMKTKFLKEHIIKEQHHHKLLHFAAMLGRYDIVKIFLEEGVDPDAKDDSYPSDTDDDLFPVGNVIELPLYGAVKANRLDIVNLFLEHKADITLNQEYNEKRRPLDCAAFYGYNNILRRLCEAKANVSLGDDAELMPAHYAALGGNGEGLKILQEFKADVLSPDLTGYTILDFAVLGGHFNLFKELRKKFDKLTLHIPVSPDQFESQSYKQHFIFSRFKELYGSGNAANFACGTDVMDLNDELLMILRSFCSLDKGEGLYHITSKMLKIIRRDKLWNSVDLLAALVFYLDNQQKQNLINSLAWDAKKFLRKVACRQNELADLFFSTADDEQIESLFNLFQKCNPSKLKNEYSSDFCFQTQATFADEFALFQENRQLNRYVMNKLNICFSDIRYLEPNKDLVSFMSTCKYPILLTCKTITGLTKTYPTDIVHNILSFLKPNYITHSNVKITTSRIIQTMEIRLQEAVDIPVPKKNKLQTTLIKKLIEFYRSDSKTQELDTQLMDHIKNLSIQLQEKKEILAIEVKSDVTGVLAKKALIEQSLLKDIVEMFSKKNFKSAYHLLKSNNIIKKLNKLILLEEEPALVRLYSIRERQDYIKSFFAPATRAQMQTSKNEQQQPAKRFRANR